MTTAENFDSLDILLRQQIEIASILEYLVEPYHVQFTHKVALFCTGIEWTTIKMFYAARAILVQRYMLHQSYYLRQCCGSTLYAIDEESVKA